MESLVIQSFKAYSRCLCEPAKQST